MSHAVGLDASPAVASGSIRPFPNWALLGLLFGLVGAASIYVWGPIGVSGTYPRVIGALARLFDGGFLAARFGKSKAPACEMVHAMERSTAVRYRDAFLGGFLIVFGARLAGGCTSGHIISGITQLSISGFIFGAAVFASGIATAKLIRTGA
jgi:uncharacterized membrane protein YedE/YeeE